MTEGEGIINVVTYNVLSTALSYPGYHNNCSPEHLHHETRFTKLLAKLGQEIELSSIICLQEVSEVWCNRLTVFFTNMNYSCVSRLYGAEFNGYMGVLIAFPSAKYGLENLVSKRVSETAYFPDDIRHEKFNGREYSAKTLKRLENAGRRWNSVIFVQLKMNDANKSFCVATYHMPCVYWDDKFMDIHASLLVRFVQEQAKGLPTILTGDFNSHPTSEAYTTITTGKKSSLVESMFHNHKDFRHISFGDEMDAAKKKKGKKGKKGGKKKDIVLKRADGVGKNKTLKAMQSAYKKFLKKEPAVTNLSNRTSDPNGGYSGCIDYIFISDEFEVVDVLDLYESREAIGSASLPDEKEMSDHLMLRASLTLP